MHNDKAHQACCKRYVGREPRAILYNTWVMVRAMVRGKVVRSLLYRESNISTFGRDLLLPSAASRANKYTAITKFDIKSSTVIITVELCLNVKRKRSG